MVSEWLVVDANFSILILAKWSNLGNVVFRCLIHASGHQWEIQLLHHHTIAGDHQASMGDPWTWRPGSTVDKPIGSAQPVEFAGEL